MAGYYRMHRGWQAHKIFRSEAFSRKDAWVWLIENALWEDRHVVAAGKSVLLKRGQLCYSIRFMADAWKWDKAAVSRYLTRLTTEAMIETETETGQTIITICNYDRYQTSSPDDETQDDTPDDTTVRQQRDSSETNNKKDKKDKKKEVGGADAQPYAFVGRIIKLKSQQLDQWRKSYPAIVDMTASLQAADDYYAEHPPPDGKWFFKVSSWLQKDNADAAVRKKEATRGDDWW